MHSAGYMHLLHNRVCEVVAVGMKNNPKEAEYVALFQ
jgi:hypothetical protein